MVMEGEGVTIKRNVRVLIAEKRERSKQNFCLTLLITLLFTPILSFITQHYYQLDDL